LREGGGRAGGRIAIRQLLLACMLKLPMGLKLWYQERVVLTLRWDDG